MFSSDDLQAAADVCSCRGLQGRRCRRIPAARYQKWLTPEGLERIRAWVQEGLSIREISGRMGIDRRTLIKWRRRCPELDGLFFPAGKYHRWLTPEGLERIRGWVQEGRSAPEIAAKIGIGSCTLYRWMERSPELKKMVVPLARYPVWVTPEGLERIREWVRAGLTAGEIAGKMEIIPSTLNRWMRRFPKLAAVLEPTARYPYSQWASPERLELVRSWRREGLLRKEIAQRIGIDENTLQKWEKRDPAFSAAIREEKEITDYIAENAVYRSALGYDVTEQTEIQTEDGSMVQVERTRHIPGRVGAQRSCLSNWRKANWRRQDGKEEA